MIVLNRCLCCY